MSLAMKFYLEKKRSHDAFIAKERSEFELGKKHLANMMGMQYESMTQEDIDKAIEYLFPSGLYAETARPMMKPPEEIYPRQKEAEFDVDGRPFDTFFYTGRPNYNQSLFDVVERIEDIVFFQDRMAALEARPEREQMLTDATLAGSRWKTKEEVEKMFFEDLKDANYDELMKALERLMQQPFSYRHREFLFQFREKIDMISSEADFLEPKFDEEGKAYIEAFGQRRTSCAKVRMTKPGTGKFTLIHADYPSHPQDISYFHAYRDRQQVMYPLQFTKLLGLVDLDVIVYEGGSSSQAGAIRYAISRCATSFVDEELTREMTIAGLLTQNIRVRERKKPGQEGARSKYTWKKR